MSDQTKSDLKPQYKVIKYLASGTFGNVYLGIDRKSNKRVALKRINPKNMTKELLQLERKNNQDVANLGRHDNLMNFLDEYVDPSSRLTVFVFDYAEGGDLFHRLGKEGYFSEADASSIIKQAFLGLDVLHKNGIIHRDIKPENLLLKTEEFPGTVAITDFGLSASLGSEDTVEYNNRGTAWYCPPEAFKSKRVGRKADVWAVGFVPFGVISVENILTGFRCPYASMPEYAQKKRLVMHEMILGIFPFEEEGYTILDAIADILDEDLEINTSAAYKMFSPDCRDLLDKLLTKDHNQRPSTKKALDHPWLKTAPTDKIHTASLSGHEKKRGERLDKIMPQVNTSEMQKRREHKKRMREALRKQCKERLPGSDSNRSNHSGNASQLKSSATRREQLREDLKERRERVSQRKEKASSSIKEVKASSSTKEVKASSKDKEQKLNPNSIQHISRHHPSQPKSRL